MARGAPPLFHLMTGGRTIRRGARGSAVQELQQFLTDQGFVLEPDGIFGPKTRAAVRAFQAANGLSADGQVGQKTRAAIATMMQAQREPPPQPQGPPGMMVRSMAPDQAMAGQSVRSVQTQPYYQTPEQSQQMMESDPAGPVPLGPGSAAQMPPQMTLPGQFPAGMEAPYTMRPPSKRPPW